jgi:hypothetical protein
MAESHYLINMKVQKRVELQLDIGNLSRVAMGGRIMVAAKENSPEFTPEGYFQIVEVLSPSTANYDRSDKFRMYRRHPSLQDYLLVDAEKVAIDLYRRNRSGNEEIFNYRAGVRT